MVSAMVLFAAGHVDVDVDVDAFASPPLPMQPKTVTCKLSEHVAFLRPLIVICRVTAWLLLRAFFMCCALSSIENVAFVEEGSTMFHLACARC